VFECLNAASVGVNTGTPGIVVLIAWELYGRFSE